MKTINTAAKNVAGKKRNTVKLEFMMWNVWNQCQEVKAFPKLASLFTEAVVFRQGGARIRRSLNKLELPDVEFRRDFEQIPVDVPRVRALGGNDRGILRIDLLVFL